MLHPNIYEKVAELINVDTIIKVTGAVDDRDRDGKHTEDVKILPKEITEITDAMLAAYQSTGKVIDEPTDAPKRRAYKSKPVVEKTEEEKKAEEEAKKKAILENHTDVINPRDHKLYILIENPEKNTDKLTELKKTCDVHPGLSPVVLVLKEGEEKKAMVMNFKVEANEELVEKLKAIVGENAVVLK